MRGLRGYILNLADGQGPPTGTVDVSAKPSAKPVNVTEAVELDLAIHRLGALTVRHQPGSASKLKADQAGHFGWDMELSPGPIDVRVTPHDPQTEYRRRFPDESAQIGKAFLTDLERLGWAGGKDGLIWDAVFGGYGSAAASMTDPFFSMGQGNWAYGGGGTGPLAGRVSVRNGIAMLAGTVFSLEMGQGLWVPVDGEPVMDPNTSSNDRWDLLCLRTDWNPQSPEYGKQSFEFIKGTPSATMLLPEYPGNTGNYRRLPLWAVKMKANTSTYDSTTGYDLRTWLTPPVAVRPQPIYRSYAYGTPLFIGANNSEVPSPLNTTLSQNEIVLSPSVAWDGYVVVSGTFNWSQFDPGDIRVIVRTEGRFQPGEAAQPNSLFIQPYSWSPLLRATGGQYVNGVGANFSTTYPLMRIPAYSDLATTSRGWRLLRFAVNYIMDFGGGNINFTEQQIAIHLWPVT